MNTHQVRGQRIKADRGTIIKSRKAKIKRILLDISVNEMKEQSDMKIMAKKTRKLKKNEYSFDVSFYSLPEFFEGISIKMTKSESTQDIYKWHKWHSVSIHTNYTC